MVLWRTNVGVGYEENWNLHGSPKYTMSMFIFFAAVRNKMANHPQ
jgi:hypothetical protein